MMKSNDCTTFTTAHLTGRLTIITAVISPISRSNRQQPKRSACSWPPCKFCALS